MAGLGYNIYNKTEQRFMAEVNIKNDNRQHVAEHNCPKQLCNREHICTCIGHYK